MTSGVARRLPRLLLVLPSRRPGVPHVLAFRTVTHRAARPAGHTGPLQPARQPPAARNATPHDDRRWRGAAASELVIAGATFGGTPGPRSAGQRCGQESPCLTRP